MKLGDVRQRRVLLKFAGFWSVRSIPGRLLRFTCTILSSAIVTLDLATNG